MSKSLKKLTKKSGIRKRHNAEDREMLRDKAIFAEILQRKRESERLHSEFSKPIEQLTRYFPQDTPYLNTALTAFPITHRPDGTPMPPWEDLTPWLQMQVTLLGMDEYGTLIVDIHIHENITRKCEAGNLDIRTFIRDRVRTELRNHTDIHDDLDYFFVIEGNRSKRNPWNGKYQSAKTKLHIHGAVVMLDKDYQKPITEAVARACGQNIGNNGQEPRSVHSTVYKDRGGAFVTYIMKYRKSRDSRLPERRHTFSNGAIGGGKMFYEGITGKWQGFSVMPHLVFTGKPGHV